MNKQKISINKLHAVYIPDTGLDSLDTPLGKQGAATLAAQMMSYGFIPNEALHKALMGISRQNGEILHETVMPILAENKGAHVKHKPMYVNFPEQVMEMAEMELFINAISHYWTFGEWKPDYPELARGLAFETVKWVELGVADDEAFAKVFTRILGSNESISDDDKSIVEQFMASGCELFFPETIPFKENLCLVAGMFIKGGKKGGTEAALGQFLKTSTDILRVITYLNEGDISLAANTKFKSMPRPQRRMFVALLEKVIREEDINRHRSKWGKLFHTLHVGEYKSAEKVNAAATKIRSNTTIRTFNGRVNAAINESNADKAVELLSQRPGEFARRLDHLFRTFNDEGDRRIIDGFLAEGVVDQIPTRVLCQVMGHLQTRMLDPEERVVFPKGSTAKAQIIPALPPLNQQNVTQLYLGLCARLTERFSALEPQGKVYIDPALQDCPLPSGQRSASPGTMTVARGTRLAFGDETKNTLRFFIYWKGRDIDLSATLHDAEFKMIERIGYTNLRSHQYESCHSGDITNAPNGASEFIDITIDGAVKAGARYVVMNVLVFSGPNFDEHEECFAGWMTRSKPKSNEIYDPKTVEGKVDLCSQSKNAIPVVFDLVEQKAIWTDLTTGRNPAWSTASTFSRRGFRTGWAGQGNNVENNKASIEQTLKAILKTTTSRLSLYKLFELHALGRGERVDTPEEADIIFGLQPGEKTISPYDINVITSEYLV